LAWLSLAPVALSLLALLCSASRWSPAYLVGSVLSAMRALVGLGMIITALTDGLLGKPWTSIPSATPAPGDQQFLTLMTWGVPVGSALIAGLSGVSIWAMMNLHTHFAVETKRMLLVIDRDVAKRETGLWLRAREYAKRKAWALAALHVRQALAYRRTVERYLLLAAAYYHLGQRDRARDALFDAQEIQPDHPRIAAMLEQIEHPTDA
jgi:tetratricopeptide (TPR) repeat protein